MELRFPKPQVVSIDPKKTILQIVDMQERFVGREPRKKGWHAEEYISNNKALLETVRKLDMVVVYQYTTSIPTPYEKIRKRLSPGWVEGDITSGPIIDELKPILKPVQSPTRPDRVEQETSPNEYIVIKTTHDIWFHTAMEDVLSTLPDIDTVIVTGTST